MSPDMTYAYEWRGRDLVGSDDDRIGKIAEIYLDEQGGQPEWALVNSGLFGSKASLVRLAGASPEGESVRVAVTKSQVKDVPGVEPGRELSQEEADLFRRYEFDYTNEDTSVPTTDDAMTRSEGEVTVVKVERDRGRARLRKYVVTEEVQQTVPVQRGKVRLERVPVTDANVD